MKRYKIFKNAILLFAMFGCATWSPTLRESHGFLDVSEQDAEKNI
jgi:hypothetical protein